MRKRNDRRERKMSEQPSSAPTASIVGHYITVAQKKKNSSILLKMTKQYIEQFLKAKLTTSVNY